MKYHLAAIFTVFVWSITYISSKIVLGVLTPMQLTLYRFIIGYICLLIIKPPKTWRLNFRVDLNLILSGLFGICLYYVLENSATRMTQASYVSIIVSTIPLITSVLAHFINRDEKFSHMQILTFMLSFSGVTIIILEGSTLDGGQLTGNLLALLASIIFGFYNIFLKRIDRSIDPLERSRKINFYGLLFISIFYLFSPDKSIPKELFEPVYILNIIFLGVVASSMCILTWSYSISGIGAVKTSRYIYLAPLITNVVSSIILKEYITLSKVLGMVLIITGMLIPSIIGKLPIKTRRISYTK